MGKQLFTNNAASQLSGVLPQGGTTLVCAATQGSRFPTPTGGDFFYLTIFTKDVYATEQNIEIVKVTARASDVMTIERDIELVTGQSGGFAYNGGVDTVYLEVRWTAGCVDNLVQKGDISNVTNTSDVDKPVSTAQASADAVVLASAASDATIKANARQAALVSGTSIKTIGGASLLGSGDISLTTTPSLVRSPRSSNTVLGIIDSGTLIDITSGTFTQTFAAVATLTTNWWCYLKNSGTGDITLDPNASETIDGLVSFVMYPGEVRLIQCDGSVLRSIVVNAFVKATASSFTFTKPPGYAEIKVELLGGGGAGGAGGVGAGAFGGTGGGGGCCAVRQFSSSVVPASLSVGVAATSTGIGGTTTFGSMASAYGGGDGSAAQAANDRSGGSGGGSGSAGNTGAGGTVNGGAGNGGKADTYRGFGEAGASALATGVGSAEYGGAAGAYSESVGGSSFRGGAGGGNGGRAGSGAAGTIGKVGGSSDKTPIATDYTGGISGGGATGGAGAVGAATVGTAGTAQVGASLSGTGGGGGGGSQTGVAGNGGAGGYGCGGGGGGSSQSGTAGSGGLGGGGYVRITGVI